MPSISQILRIKSRVVNKLLQPDPDSIDYADPAAVWLSRNFVGVGPAYRIKEGEEQPEMCLAIYVRMKLAREYLGKYYLADFLRKEIEKLPIDVVETGPIRPMMAATAPLIPKCHISIGGDVSMAGRATHGTLCAFATSGSGEPNLLSCAHVLDGHNGLFKLVVSRDEVVADISRQATLLPEYLTRMPGYGFCKSHQQDCVLARLRAEFAPNFDLPGDLGRLSSPMPVRPRPRMKVLKVGKTITSGKVVCPHLTVAVSYPTQTAILENQILVGPPYEDYPTGNEPFAQPGDSGSLVITQVRGCAHAVGMVVAAGDPASLLPRHQRLRPGYTIVSPLGDVLHALGASLLVN